MTVAVEREPAAVSGARELGLPEPSVRSIFLKGAPRFAREMFGPVLQVIRVRDFDAALADCRDHLSHPDTVFTTYTVAQIWGRTAVKAARNSVPVR